MAPHATLLYGSLNLLLFVVLSAIVSIRRVQANAYVGDEAPPAVVRASRAHGNLAESVGIAVAMLLAIELGGGGSTITHALGGAYLACRIAHGVGVLAKNGLAAVGAMGTLAVLAAQGGYALMLHARLPG